MKYNLVLIFITSLFALLLTYQINIHLLIHSPLQPTRKENLFHIVLSYDKHIPVGSFCAIESLANVLQHDHDNHVIVWMSNHALWPKQFQELVRRGRVHIMPIDFDRMVEDTPFQGFYNQTNFDFGKFKDQNIANALRLAIVYKYGGMYLDSDFIVVRDPSTLRNGANLQSQDSLNNAVFKFNRGDPLLLRLMTNFVENYNGNAWGKQGPGLFTRVILETNAKSTIEIWPIPMMSPVHWREWSMFFAPASKEGRMKAIQDDTIMIHTWHKLSKSSETKLCKRGKEEYKASLIGALREEFCPLTLQISENDCVF